MKEREMRREGWWSERESFKMKEKVGEKWQVEVKKFLLRVCGRVAGPSQSNQMLRNWHWLLKTVIKFVFLISIVVVILCSLRIKKKVF